MREVLKSFIPRQHWAASNVEIVPTVATVKSLAQWGGVGVFTAFWMIGTAICVLLFLRSLSLSFVFENNLSFVADPFLLPDPSLLHRTTTGDKSFAWAKSFVVEPPSEEWFFYTRESECDRFFVSKCDLIAFLSLCVWERITQTKNRRRRAHISLVSFSFWSLL